MPSRTTAALVVACLAVGLTPAYALSLNLGANIGGSANANSGGGSSAVSTGLALGVSADTSLDLGLNTSATGDGTGDVAADTSADGSAGADANAQLNAVINLIQSSDWTSASLDGVAIASASVTDTSAWVNSTNQASFDAVLNANATDITELQAAISANAALSAWLDSENVDASSVVALEVAADGSAQIFTD